MEYGRVKRSGSLVRAADAVRGASYVCPTCGLPLELRRGEDLEYFAHWRGLEDTRDCEFFAPGAGESGRPQGADDAIVLVDPSVEDDPAELGLILDQLDGEWRVGLRLPEIPHDELGGEVSLNELRRARVEVSAGDVAVSRISGLDLRPGVGAARVQVPPSVRDYQARVAGPWPPAIDTRRWQLQSRGLEVKGTLFRLRSGEWTRLLMNSRVHSGERLLVLAETGWARPESLVAEKHAQISSGGLTWIIWEIRLPDEPVDSATAWLARIGHRFVQKPWSVELAAPPRMLDERGEPLFWVGDSPVLTLEAPQGGAEATVSVEVGTDSVNASVTAPASRRIHVAIPGQRAELARIGVFTERKATLTIGFVEPPSRESLLEALAKTARLRVWLGHQVVEAWHEPSCRVPVGSLAVQGVLVDLGLDGARVRVTVWERDKQRSRPGLDARSAARAIESSLSTASRIELDAENFGRVEIVPQRVTVEPPRNVGSGGRLSWYDHLASMSPRASEHTVATVIGQPRAAMSLIVRRVGPSALIRARLELRRRRGVGGHR